MKADKIGRAIMERAERGDYDKPQRPSEAALRKLVAEPVADVLKDAKIAIERSPKYGDCSYEGDPGRHVRLVERIDEQIAAHS